MPDIIIGRPYIALTTTQGPPYRYSKMSTPQKPLSPGSSDGSPASSLGHPPQNVPDSPTNVDYFSQSTQRSPFTPGPPQEPRPNQPQVYRTTNEGMPPSPKHTLPPTARVLPVKPQITPHISSPTTNVAKGTIGKTTRYKINGEKTVQNTKNGNITSFRTYNEDGDLTSGKIYDKNGGLRSEIILDKEKKSVTTYNEKGQKISRVIHGKNENDNVTILYNNGKKTYVINGIEITSLYGENGNILSRTFTENGTIIREIGYA